MAINEDESNQLLDKFVADLGATSHAGLVVIGESLGLYRAMAQAGEPLTSAELAKRTGTNERYVREWLCSQAAGGYVGHEADRYFLTEEQAFTLADEKSLAYLPDAIKAFREGKVLLTEKGKPLAVIKPLEQKEKEDAVIRRLEAEGILRSALKQ